MTDKEALAQKTARTILFSLVAGGLGVLLFFVFYWVSLLLINHHPGFIPNAEKRMEMFKFLSHHRRGGGGQKPQQGEHWIF